jgi:hypothetical protein
LKRHTQDLAATKICSLILRKSVPQGRYEMEHWISRVEKTKDLEDLFLLAAKCQKYAHIVWKRLKDRNDYSLFNLSQSEDVAWMYQAENGSSDYCFTQHFFLKTNAAGLLLRSSWAYYMHLGNHEFSEEHYENFCLEVIQRIGLEPWSCMAY